MRVSNEEYEAIERAYIDELVRLVARNWDGIQYARHRVVGRYPETEVVILFAVPGYSECLYGARDQIWAEGGHASPEEATRSAGYSWDRISEIVVAHPIELPSECHPDDEGITWVELWSDD